MNDFDPTRAVMVDDAAENSEVEDFLAQMEKKAKAFRSQVFADSFRQLATASREAQQQLLKSAQEKFSELAEKDRTAITEAFATRFSSLVADAMSKLKDDAMEAINKRLASNQAKFDARFEKLLGSLEKLEGLVRESGASQKDSKAITDALNGLREEIASMEKQHGDGHAELAESIAALESKASAKPKDEPVEWSFTFDRDQLGRIDGQVRAKRIK